MARGFQSDLMIPVGPEKKSRYSNLFFIELFPLWKVNWKRSAKPSLSTGRKSFSRRRPYREALDLFEYISRDWDM